MASNDICILANQFPGLDSDLVEDVLDGHGGNYRKAYRTLLEMCPDEQILSTRPKETFSDILTTICVVPELVETSRMDKKIKILKEKLDVEPIQNQSFEDLVATFVAKAFRLQNKLKSRKYHGSVPDLSDGNFFQGCNRLYRELPTWQQPLLHAALREMLSEDCTDSLKIMCGLMQRASGECMARKQEVFFMAIDRSVSDDSEAMAATVVEDSSTDSLAHQKNALFEAARVAVDKCKDQAFKSVFIEPSKMYFRAVHDYTMEGDVEVHGSNAYIAILKSTLGVKLARSPLMEDEVKGVAAFKEALYPSALEELWKPENLGKSWEAVFGRGMVPTVLVNRRVQTNVFYVRGSHVEDLARGFKHSTNAQKLQIKPYLEAFARHFSSDQLTEPLCNHLLNQDSLSKSMDAVFKAFAPPSEIENANGQAKFWLWDVMTGDFRKDRAIALLRFAGIIKNDTV